VVKKWQKQLQRPTWTGKGQKRQIQVAEVFVCVNMNEVCRKGQKGQQKLIQARLG